MNTTYKELKNIITNYECTFINDKELLFSLCQLLYDREIINGSELDRLYDRVEKIQSNLSQ